MLENPWKININNYHLAIRHRRLTIHRRISSHHRRLMAIHRHLIAIQMNHLWIFKSQLKSNFPDTQIRQLETYRLASHRCYRQIAIPMNVHYLEQ